MIWGLVGILLIVVGIFWLLWVPIVIICALRIVRKWLIVGKDNGRGKVTIYSPDQNIGRRN